MSGPTKEQENTERTTIHSARCPCVDCEIGRVALGEESVAAGFSAYARAAGHYDRTVWATGMADRAAANAKEKLSVIHEFWEARIRHVALAGFGPAAAEARIHQTVEKYQAQIAAHTAQEVKEAVAEVNAYWEGKLQANYADTFFLALVMCIMAPSAEAAEAGIEMAERIAALMPPARVQEIKAEAEKVLLVGDGEAEALAALRLANSLEEKGPNGLPSGGAK